MRVLHQAPPPVATSDTRSPSRTPLFRNSATAPLAWMPWKRVIWMSSKTRMKVRPVRSSRRWLLEMIGLRGAAWRRRVGQLHRLEAHDLLRLAVLEDREVGLVSGP